MTNGGDPRTDEQLRAVIEAFVLRARRVLAHSLCLDEDSLMALADGAWIAVRQGGVQSMRQVLPSEEALESLAARARPLTLKEDGIHYNEVLNAISAYLVRYGHRDEAEWCRELKKDWKSVDIKAGAPAGYSLAVTSQDAEKPHAQLTDVVLADAWFYGDVVHADQTLIEAASAFEINHRFAAAAVRTAQIAIMARDTLSFIRWLVDGNLIDLGRKALEEVPVTVESRDLELAGLFSAPPGTDAAGALGGELLDSGWENARFPGTEDGQWLLRIPWGRNEE